MLYRIICEKGHESYTSNPNPSTCVHPRCNARIQSNTPPARAEPEIIQQLTKSEKSHYQKIQTIQEEKNTPILKSYDCPKCSRPKSKDAFQCMNCSMKERYTKASHCRDCGIEIKFLQKRCGPCHLLDRKTRYIISLKTTIKHYQRRINEIEDQIAHLEKQQAMEKSMAEPEILNKPETNNPA